MYKTSTFFATLAAPYLDSPCTFPYIPHAYGPSAIPLVFLQREHSMQWIDYRQLPPAAGGFSELFFDYVNDFFESIRILNC